MIRSPNSKTPAIAALAFAALALVALAVAWGGIAAPRAEPQIGSAPLATATFFEMAPMRIGAPAKPVPFESVCLPGELEIDSSEPEVRHGSTPQAGRWTSPHATSDLRARSQRAVTIRNGRFILLFAPKVSPPA